ncbi:MAG: dihydroneopterin aldolase [Clostridiales bacterium]
MDKIILRDLEFWGCHGANPGEQEQPQRFIVNAQLFLDTAKAGINDDLRQTVNYGVVFSRLKQIVEQESFQLLEALAEKLATAVLMDQQISLVQIEVEKCRAIVGADCFRSAVWVERRR